MLVILWKIPQVSAAAESDAATRAAEARARKARFLQEQAEDRATRMEAKAAAAERKRGNLEEVYVFSNSKLERILF